MLATRQEQRPRAHLMGLPKTFVFSSHRLSPSSLMERTCAQKGRKNSDEPAEPPPLRHAVGGTPALRVSDSLTRTCRRQTFYSHKRRSLPWPGDGAPRESQLGGGHQVGVRRAGPAAVSFRTRIPGTVHGVGGTRDALCQPEERAVRELAGGAAEGNPSPWLDNRALPYGSGPSAYPRARVCHAGMYARTHEHTPCGGTNRRHDEMPAVHAEGGWVTGVPFPAVWYKGHILPLVTATQWG